MDLVLYWVGQLDFMQFRRDPHFGPDNVDATYFAAVRIRFELNSNISILVHFWVGN